MWCDMDELKRNWFEEYSLRYQARHEHRWADFNSSWSIQKQVFHLFALHRSTIFI